MKLHLILSLFALIGGAYSFRLKRQAPAVGPEAVPDVAPEPVPTPKAAGLNVALGFMVDELEKQTALGGPVNPSGLQKACIVALKIKLLGGEVDKPTQDRLDALVADFALQAAAPSQFSAFAAPPASSKANFAQFA